jgi:DnaK suppressor protein
MIAMPVEDLETPDKGIAPGGELPHSNRRRETLKQMLKDHEEEVLGRLRALRAFPTKSEPVKDREEAALEDVTRDLEVWLVEQGFATLRRIDEALVRLDQGTYGICARCHHPISDERLRALPFAALCQECQSREEEKAPPPSPRL